MLRSLVVLIGVIVVAIVLDIEVSCQSSRKSAGFNVGIGSLPMSTAKRFSGRSRTKINRNKEAPPSEFRPQTTSGRLKGRIIKTPYGRINKFLGVRYAKSPIGDR